VFVFSDASRKEIKILFALIFVFISNMALSLFLSVYVVK
jgi:hypothetical protein